MRKLFYLSVVCSVNLVSAMGHEIGNHYNDKPLIDFSFFSPQTTVDVHPKIITQVGSRQQVAPLYFQPKRGCQSSPLWVSPYVAPTPEQVQSALMQHVYQNERTEVDDTVVDIDTIDNEESHSQRDHKRRKKQNMQDLAFRAACASIFVGTLTYVALGS